MRVAKAIATFLGITLWYFGVAFLGYALGGAGHGTTFFGAVAIAPFSAPGLPDEVAIGAILYGPILGILTALRNKVTCAWLAAVLVGIHIIGVVIICLSTEWENVASTWHRGWPLIVFWILFYLSGYLTIIRLLQKHLFAERSAGDHDRTHVR
ncbi:MAG: dimethyl sulfoxide reductase anchor subunit [Verrucomicrobiae bacterium]|nr:dimethyl sulfoxide reductase anchor subunit [Verrucomicrobiae bacterium]